MRSTNVYRFPERPGERPVVVPADIPENELATMKINGESLERVGIYDGDFVVVRKRVYESDIQPDTVHIIYLPLEDDLVARKVECDGEYFILHYCGLDSRLPLRVHLSEFEFRGQVIGLSRQQTEWMDVVDQQDGEWPSVLDGGRA